MTELFEFVSERLGVDKLKEEVTQLQVANVQLQERLETNVVDLKDSMQSLQTVMLQQMVTQEAKRQAEAKEQQAQMMALFANLQTGQPVARITTGEIQDISPLSTQTTDSSAKRSPEETHEHISKKTKSGQSSPNLNPAGTSHSPPSNMAEETRGKPP
jgi:predicted  nucleic acid-binding Zn-ribbon protein